MSDQEAQSRRWPYGVLMLVYAAVVGPLLLVARRRKLLRESPSPVEIVVYGIATHKLSRLLSREKVTSVLRSPFTEFEEPSHLSEVNERPRGRGMRRAIGQLLACPFCLGMWVASGFTLGAAYLPGPTVALASLLNSLALSDFLHIAYVRAARAVE
jgi:hypothetical protein